MFATLAVIMYVTVATFIFARQKLTKAKKKADNLSANEMKSVTGGMPLPPGMKF